MINIVSEKNNFLYLVISLVFLLLVGALIEQFPTHIGQQFFQAVTVITLATGVIGFKSPHPWFHSIIGFIILVLMVVIIGFGLNIANMSYVHLILMIFFYSWCMFLAIKQMLFTGPIDAHKIIGAICIYLLMGMLWALFYLLIAQAIPGAFNGIEYAIWYDNFSDAAYYSFVTLTTLGYGDITPVSSMARFLVYMEAIVGVFYMAILVASLIGIRTSGMMNSKD